MSMSITFTPDSPVVYVDSTAGTKVSEISVTDSSPDMTPTLKLLDNGDRRVHLTGGLLVLNRDLTEDDKGTFTISVEASMREDIEIASLEISVEELVKAQPFIPPMYPNYSSNTASDEGNSEY